MSEALLCQHARDILDSSLRQCSVREAFSRKIATSSRDGRTYLHFDGDAIEITEVRSLYIVAAGKASVEMLEGFLDRLPKALSLKIKGVLIGPDVDNFCTRELFLSRFQLFTGGHPLPNQASLDGATAALALAREASEVSDCLCVFLISGGASAMMELPLDSGVSLSDITLFYQQLVHSGATISEINCIRKHLSAIKGGRLALAAGSKPCLTLLVSDVPPQHLDSLASGPTLPDASTVEECLSLVAQYSLDKSLPDSVRRYFYATQIPETPKAGAPTSSTWVLLDSDDLAAAATDRAKQLGYHVVVDNSCDNWNYSEAADYLIDRIRKLSTEQQPVCLISTGEVTVTISGASSSSTDECLSSTHIGGRNQHFALYAATQLVASYSPMCILSAGSDGIDGNSIATGAVVDSEMLKEPRDLQQAQLALSAFDSFTFLHSRGATVVTGPTGNNLRDLRVLLIDQAKSAGAA